MPVHMSILVLFTDVRMILLVLVRETATRGIEFSGMEHGAARKRLCLKGHLLETGAHIWGVLLLACQLV